MNDTPIYPEVPEGRGNDFCSMCSRELEDDWKISYCPECWEGLKKAEHSLRISQIARRLNEAEAEGEIFAEEWLENQASTLELLSELGFETNSLYQELVDVSWMLGFNNWDPRLNRALSELGLAVLLEASFVLSMGIVNNSRDIKTEWLSSRTLSKHDDMFYIDR